jgi:hypothetical protein
VIFDVTRLRARTAVAALLLLIERLEEVHWQLARDCISRERLGVGHARRGKRIVCGGPPGLADDDGHRVRRVPGVNLEQRLHDAFLHGVEEATVCAAIHIGPVVAEGVVERDILRVALVRKIGVDIDLK